MPTPTRAPPPGSVTASKAAVPEPSQGGGTLLGNASALLTGRLVVAVLGWAGTILVVRSLTQDEFGQFSFVFGLLGMVSIVSDMGMGRVAIAGVLDADRDRAEFAGTYVVLRTVLGVLGYLLALAVVIIAGYPQTVIHATLVAGIAVLLATPSHAYHVAFQAHLRMGPIAVTSVIGQAAQLALTVALVIAGGSVVWFVVPAVLAEVVILALLAPRAHRLMDFRYVVRPSIWREIAAEAVPLSIAGALVTLYTQVDTVMLSKMDTFASVGAYSVAYKFSDLARFAATAITMPLLTMLVTAWPDDVRQFRSVVRRGAMLMAFIGGLAVVQSLLFADPVVELLYGADYRIAGDATRLLIVAVAISFFGRLAINVLIATDNRRSYPVIAAGGLIVNVVFNLALIPRRSFEGAAIATVVTESAVLIALVVAASRVEGLRPLGVGFLVRSGLVVAVSLAGGWFLSVRLAWPVAAVGTLLLYLAVSHLVRSTGPLGLRSLIVEGDAEDHEPSFPAGR